MHILRTSAGHDRQLRQRITPIFGRVIIGRAMRVIINRNMLLNHRALGEMTDGKILSIMLLLVSMKFTG